jgi:DNA-binding transcriptional regulator YdaS (Cro superfamily)
MLIGGMEKQFIDDMGGIKAVALLLGVHRSQVCNWRNAKLAIPWKHRPALARAAADKAVNLPSNFWDVKQ